MAEQYGWTASGNEEGLDPTGIRVLEIRVRGQLDSTWSDWFENLEIRLLEGGEMILSGPIPDQAALMGVLNKLDRLNLTLLSVCEMPRHPK